MIFSSVSKQKALSINLNNQNSSLQDFFAQGQGGNQQQGPSTQSGFTQPVQPKPGHSTRQGNQPFNPYAEYGYADYAFQGAGVQNQSYVNNIGYKPITKKENVLLTLFKASVIGILVALLCFVGMNYSVITAQISDYFHRNDKNNVNVVDTDSDGLPDWWEDKYKLNKDDLADANLDQDKDSLDNLSEYKYGTDPFNQDTDGDGRSDGQEVKNGYDPVKAGEARLDSDADGMPDFWEQMYGLNVNDNTDKDKDSDRDGLVNLNEFVYGSDPNNSDTDGDGRLDGEEVSNGYDPIIAGEARLRDVDSPDSDQDGMPDWWEELNGLNSKDGNDKNSDKDNDSLSNYDEWLFDTDPNNPDTDEDGYNDGAEVDEGYDPTVPGNALIEGRDSDQDGLTDKQEIDIFGTNPDRRDTDGDGYADGVELDIGRDPSGDGFIKATIVVPSIGVNAPLIWGEKTDEDSMQEYLRKGVVHYPGTSTPGRKVSMDGYVTGHSSYYKWDPGEYKYVFKELHKMEVGDTYYFEYKLQNGKTVRFDYKTISRDIYKPDNPKLFQSTADKKIIALVSCHPPGTSWKRVMYRSELVE